MYLDNVLTKIDKMLTSKNSRLLLSVALLLLIVLLNLPNINEMMTSLLFISPNIFVFILLPSNRINGLFLFILLSLLYLGINYVSLYVIANGVFYWSGLLLVFVVNIFLFVIPTFLFSLVLTYLSKSVKEH